MKFTNMRTAGFVQNRHLMGESGMFVEDKTKIASSMGGDTQIKTRQAAAG